MEALLSLKSAHHHVSYCGQDSPILGIICDDAGGISSDPAAVVLQPHIPDRTIVMLEVHVEHSIAVFIVGLCRQSDTASVECSIVGIV